MIPTVHVFPAEINIECSYCSALNSYAARDFFTAPTVMKSGLHVKTVNLSDKWLVYPVSFDHIATVALNQRNCSQVVETERVHLICSWSVQRESEMKYSGRIINKDGYCNSLPAQNEINTSYQ